MDNDLLQHLEDLHTTPMGAERVRRNLALSCEDVVAWCRAAVLRAEEITRKGKNWYVYTGTAVLTVNAHSYTIITAHRKASKEPICPT